MGLFTDSDSDRPCLYCEHWGGAVAGGTHAICVRDGRKYVQAQPERGCVYWVRAIGAEDEAPVRNRGESTRR